MVSNLARRHYLVLLMVTLGGSQLLFSQSTGGGSVTGLVQDPSGAMVPDASITLASSATGVTLATKSSSAGQFVFPVVPAAEYTLTVSAKGFSQSVVNGVIVRLGQTTNVPVELKVGATTATVEVTASLVRLDSTTAQDSTGMDQNTYAELPLALTGAPRSPTIFSDLMPGVADAPTNNSSMQEPGQKQIFAQTINGGQTLASEVYFDGVAMLQTNVAGDYRYQPVPTEAIAEFTLIQNNFSAEYSRTPGGVVSFNTRSGTNQWHGELYEYNENAAFNSRGFFAPKVPVDRQNEFGASAGGAIKKDKTFVFGYYSGFRYSAEKAPFQTTIPTMAMRNGDFSKFVDASGNQIPIYDPATTQCSGGVCTRQQFPGNIIPSDRIVGPAKQFLAYIPTPINNNITNNFLGGGVVQDTFNRYGAKVDQYINDKNVVHAFWGYTPFRVYYPELVYKLPFAGIGFEEPDSAQIFRISLDHTFSPTLLNHLTYGYNRDRALYAAIRTLLPPVTLGIQNIPNVTPAFSLGRYGEAGWGDPGQDLRENGNAISDFISWMKGKHQLKIGGEFRRYADNTIPIASSHFSFSTQETALPTNLGATGNEFASFLLGAVDNASQQYALSEVGARFNYVAAYIQDDFKVTPKLTLNLGLRYDIPFTRRLLRNEFASFDPNVPNPGAGGRLGAISWAGTGPYRNNRVRFSDTRFNLWQPRFGFAYKLNDKTVLRGGFGIFEGSAGDVLENGTRTAYSYGYNASPSFATRDLGVTPAFYITDGFPQFPRPPLIDPTLNNGSDINYLAREDGTPPRVNYWNLNVQRSLPGGLLLEVGYVANSAHHISSNLLNLNQVDPKYLALGDTLNAQWTPALGQSIGVPLPFPGFQGTVAQALRPYPQYLTIFQAMQTSGKSHYNSLQAKLQRQFANGLSVLVSYTYAKLMSTGESQHQYLNSNWGAQDTYNRAAELTVSGALPPQVLNLAYVYELPFGKGKRYANKGGVESAVLGGWQVSAIQRYQSGMPMNVGVPNTLPLGNFELRPNIVPGQSLRASWSGKFDPANDVYLNAAAFSTPAPFSFGNAARVLPVRGFAFFNEDVGLTRYFKIREGWQLAIAANGFNIFNRTTFGSPDTGNPGINPNFGHIGYQANTPRVFQLSADIKF
jgi:hypothetical protein